MFSPTNPTPTNPSRKRMRTWLAALLAASALAVLQGGAVAQSRADYSQPELDRMLAPIALYPDPLLSQILMAATYPVEVVEAARWSRAHPALQGDAAVRAVEDEDWDPSVKSLIAFPGVLARMDEDLEWTRQLGDAFLDQEAQVMETVQRLRRRARAAGTLDGDARIRVVDYGQTLAVEPADPTIIYVPYYDSRVAYGTWWWPAYPPVVWAPWPGYAVRYPRSGHAVGFFWGLPVRVSVGFFFGAVDWPRRQVRVVNVTNYYYRPVIVRRSVEVHRHVVVSAPGPWRHDAHHRRGVTYRTPDMQRRFAPLAPLEAHRAEPRRPETAAPRTEPRAAAAPAPTTRADPRATGRDAGTEGHRGDPPQDRRTGFNQPGGGALRPAAPSATPQSQNSVAPAVSAEPPRNRAQDRVRPAAAAPSVAPPSGVDTAPNTRDTRDTRDARNKGTARDARRGEARDAGPAQVDRRGAAPGVQRENESAQRGQRHPPEGEVQQQRRPRRDNQSEG